MRCILLTLLLLVQGCTLVHREGELPEVEFDQFEEFCTKRFKIGTSGGGPQAKCVIHLKTIFLW
jgi:hypothetical protein